MQSIKLTSTDSWFDFRHGEGSVGFDWEDSAGIKRSLSIDIDGWCSRKMPIRSGFRLEIVEVAENRVRLRFRPELAAKLELDTNVNAAAKSQVVGIVVFRLGATLLR